MKHPYPIGTFVYYASFRDKAPRVPRLLGVVVGLEFVSKSPLYSIEIPVCEPRMPLIRYRYSDEVIHAQT